MVSLIPMFLPLLVVSRRWPLGENPRKHALIVLLQTVKRACFAAWLHKLFVNRTSALTCWLCGPSVFVCCARSTIVLKRAFLVEHCLEPNNAVYVVSHTCQRFHGATVDPSICVLNCRTVFPVWNCPCVRKRRACRVVWRESVREKTYHSLFFTLHSACTLQQIPQ